jgi:hypothetical protein
LDLAGDFLSTYGQLNVPQWINNGIKVRETLCFTIRAPILFPRPQPLRLLTLWNWNSELSLEKSQI